MAGSAELARRFARALALTLLGLSVAANALAHGLDAYRLPPAWWVVVIVSAIAPAVLGAVVHLAVLVGRLHAVEVVEDDTTVVDPETLDEHGLSRLWETAPPAAETERVTELIAAGVGRRRLSRELGVSEYEARRLIDRARPTTPSDAAPSAAVLTGATP